MDNFEHVDWEKFRHDLAFPRITPACAGNRPSHICADTVRAAADKDLKAFFGGAADLNLAAAKQIIATRRLLVICNARANWMEYKEQ